MSRIAIAILSPVVFLLLMEAILRLVGYGYPVSFFLPVAGQDAVTGNPRYTYQYFPRHLVREPDLIRMDRKKPAGTCRIFVLGGSAARGTPEPRFGFGRILEVMLEEACPGRRFEVVNTAMVAINSHVVLRIATECAAYDPDLFVVYMGNNEVVGPFGAGTVLTGHVPPRWLVTASLAARSLRTGQLIENILRKLGGKPDQGEWLGMEMFLKHRVAAGDPRLGKVYHHFEANLNDIAEIAQDAGIPMILCTVPVNLRNCAPLASDHSDEFDDASRAEWEKLYRAGAALEAQARWAQADETYARAERLDDRYAELHFRRARCALALDDPKAALGCFETARDLDTLRFRADSEINRIIRKTGDDDSVFLLDAEERFKGLSRVRNGIPGDEVFYEHVHLTFEGNYELARMVFHETVKRLDLAAAKAPASLQRCADLLGLSGRDRFQMATSMMNLIVAPPFTNQVDYYDRCEKLHARIRSLREHAAGKGLDKAERRLTAALEARPNDLHGRVALARVQLVREKGAEAESTVRALLQSLPNRANLHSLLGQALLIQDRTAEAEEAFEKSFSLSSLPAAHMILAADVYEREGDTKRALAYARRALAEQPNSANGHNRLAEIHLERGEREQALEHLQRADSLLPGNGRTLYNLSRAHFESEHRETAVQKLRETLKANPFHPGAQMHLGLILKKQGHLEEAAKLLSEVVRHKPDRLDLRLHLAETKVGLRQLDEAESDYRAVRQAAYWAKGEASPDMLKAALGLAWVLAVRPDATPEQRAEALTLAKRVVSSTGRNAAIPLDVLAAALAASKQFDRALDCAEEAWRIARAGSDPDFVKAVMARMDLYRKNKPYRLPEQKGLPDGPPTRPVRSSLEAPAGS